MESWDKNKSDKKTKKSTVYVLLGIATGYGLDSRNSIPGSGKRFFSIPLYPDWH
jgi:hypothetical protein